MKKLLNIEYACIHANYWMIYGIVSSFASVFLLGRGYSNMEIGIILAVANVVAVVLQPFAADLADRSKRLSLIGITQIMTIMMMVMTVGLFVLQGKSMALGVIFVLLIAWHTIIQPLINSLNFKLEESGVHINFGIARSAGSLAYSVLMAILGSMVEKYGIIVLPISSEVIMAMMLLSLVLTKKQYDKVKASNAREGVLKLRNEDTEEINLMNFIRRNKIFVVANLGVVGLFFSNSVMNNYLMQIVDEVGGTSEDMGRILFVMAFLEIPTLVCFDFLRKKFTCQTMLKVGAIGFTVKIVMCHLAQSVGLILAAQFFQLFAFGLFLPAMVHFIDEIMSKGEAVKGQSVFTMMVTLTTIFSSLAGGAILDVSGAKMLTLVASIATAMGAAIIFLTVDRIRK
ncbi:MAG: MFS transporter [Emergencia sp.]